MPPQPSDPNLLVGTETSDDAGVYRIAPDLALVQTVDFFPPLVDDPYEFGRIAAANALSDVYAMNGRPLTVLNVAAFPDDELPLSILSAILEGASERVREAGATTVGGHTVRDAEIKFGLSVTGLVDPAELLTNGGARPGDALVLTKPLGTGFVTTAAKKGSCPEALLNAAVRSMTQLNAVGRDALRGVGLGHAMTDITGFGLAGHAIEMAEASGVTLEIELSALPLIEGSLAVAQAKYHTRASRSNREFGGSRIELGPKADPVRQEYAFDAQTSGGLLIALPEERAGRLIEELEARGAEAAAWIGRVVPRRGSLALRLV